MDVVLTTRELARMIKQAGIDFDSLPDEEMDAPLGISTGAADIFANTGGVMEAALRTAYEIVTGRALPFAEPARRADRRASRASRRPRSRSRARCPSGRSSKASTLKVAVAHGLGNAQQVIDRDPQRRGGSTTSSR